MKQQLSTASATPRPRRSATDDAYERIKRRILTCELAPGIEIRENSLATTIGFGRWPVREALRRLVQEGFVDVRPRQGYRVSPISIKSVHEVFELRMLLEPAAVELAAKRAPHEALLAMHALAHSTYTHGDLDSYERFIVDNREFHVRIAAAGNERLAHTLRILLEEMQRLFFLSLDVGDSATEQMHEHHDLHDALLERDAERARAIVTEQILHSRQRVVHALLSRISGTDQMTTSLAVSVSHIPVL